ncbi:conserved hypothetical protein [Vibrio chagasii]|nr:conserved hypothetical protein [Vibrio chagasii]
MAKVFAVTSINGKLELQTWPSGAAFSRDGNSFLDERFIYIATTRDFNEGLFKSPHENPDTTKGHFGVKLLPVQLEAHSMMHKAHMAWKK